MRKKLRVQGETGEKCEKKSNMYTHNPVGGVERDGRNHDGGGVNHSRPIISIGVSDRAMWVFTMHGRVESEPMSL